MTVFQNTQTKHPASVLKRLLMVLTAIKNNKGRAGTKEISDFLKANGIDVSLRTIQRDLRVMRDFGVPIDGDNCSPQGWRIDTNNPLAEVVELLEALPVTRPLRCSCHSALRCAAVMIGNGCFDIVILLRQHCERV